MKIEVELNAETLAKRVEDEIVKRVFEENRHESRDAKIGVRAGIDKAVKAYIHEVVERATKEIARKAMLLVITKLDEEDAENDAENR